MGRGVWKFSVVVEHLPEMNQVVGSISGMERKKGQKGGGGREGGEEGEREREEMEG